MKRKRLQLLLALLITAAMGAWGKQIYISYPAWPSGTTSVSAGNLVLEMEPSDSFENLKSKIQDKSELNPSYMHLYYNGSECANTEILAQKGITEGSVLTLVYIPPYAVKLKDGTADAGNWTATVGTSTTAKPLPVGGLNPKDPVTLKYGGRLKVKSVNATHDGWNGDLSNIPASLIQDDGRTVIVPDGITLKGKLDVSTIPYEIVIPAGATVTLAGVTIEGTSVKDDAHKHAGITCQGNATIILKDDTENTVTGFHENYPGIYVPEGKTLIIQGGKEGTGKLTASSNGAAAGIGAGYAPRSCGNIEIQGGDITATGDWSSAGIGGGPSSVCGTITISGGTVTATGGEGGAGIGSGNGYGANCGNITISGGTVKATSTENGAGIGSGLNATCGDITISGGTVKATATYNGAGIGSGLFGTCGNITITDDVALVMATKGEYAPYSIGKGYEGSCGTVTIGGTKYWQNNAAVGDGATYLAQATIEYPAPAYTLLSAATTSDYGKVVCAAGHLHDAKTAVPTGCIAVGILGQVTATGQGLILALQNATSQNWNTINGWTSVTTYAGTTLNLLPDDAARSTNLTSYTALGETAVSNWAVGHRDDYDAIFQNLGSKTVDDDGYTYDGNVNAYIKGVGGTEISGSCWSATESDNHVAWYFGSQHWNIYSKAVTLSVRPVLGFGGEATPALSITSPSVGQVIGSDGKNYAYASLPTGVTAVAKICFVSGSNGLALALADEGEMKWSTAIETCAAHTPAFTGGTWKLATKDEWDNMINAADSGAALRDGFSSVGGTNMLSVVYWSSTEYEDDSEGAWYYSFGYGGWNYDNKGSDAVCVRACLEF